MSLSKGVRLFSIVAALVFLVPRPGSAQTFYSTGQNVVNSIDQNWLVSTGFGSWSSAFDPAHLWVHGTQSWISNLTSATNGTPPWFTFRQTFDLTGYDPATASLSFRWGCDDVPNAVSWLPVLSVNGGAFGYGGTCGAYDIGAGSLVTLNSGFVAGSNYIDFRVQGNGTTDGMGLAVQSFTAREDVPGTVTPEPVTMTLVATGLLGLAGIGSRRKKRSQG